VPTPIAGSSDVVDRRFVNYASAAKSEMLEIPSDLVLTAAALRSLSAWHDSAAQPAGTQRAAGVFQEPDGAARWRSAHSP
jgi:hypothetical protein